MRWIKHLAITLTILLAALLALPFFIPLDGYLPQIEKLASDRLKEPVKIASLSIGLLPLPHAKLTGITVGKKTDIEIGAMTLTPDIFSLFDDVKIISRLRIENITIRQVAFEKMPRWIKADGTPGQVKLAHLQIRGLQVHLDKSMSEPVDADIFLADGNDLQQASVSLREGKLRVEVKPTANSKIFTLQLAAKNWKLPLDPAIQFDALDALGEVNLNASSLNLASINGKLYGGSLKGSAALNWKSVWRLTGSMELAKVELQSLVPLLAAEAKVSGKLDANSRFSASSATAGKLAHALQLDADFKVLHGVLYNVDIAQAAKSFLKSGSRGGETRFDTLSGHLKADAAGQHLRNLQISSGALAASGDLDISPQQQLKGRVTAELKAGISLVAVPLDVSGSVKEPVLFPTKGALAGAAAGTMLLGPMGTGLGVKAGAALEKLFGK